MSPTATAALCCQMSGHCHQRHHRELVGSGSRGFTALLAVTPRYLGNHGQGIWIYELAAGGNARRCMKNCIYCLHQEITYDQDFPVCAQHA